MVRGRPDLHGSPQHAGDQPLLGDTPAVRDLGLDGFDALVVCGGQGPMFQFRDHEDVKRALVRFYEARKPTAALCHGTCALLDARLSDGSY